MSEFNEDIQWIVEIKMTVGCVNGDEVKTGSIGRVPEKIREAEAKGKGKGYSYKPEFVAMGPFHRGTRSDLQIMEETKWRYMHKLLSRPTQNKLMAKTVESCCEAFRMIESLIRASYGEKIEMGAEELARIMLLDACFLFELLLGLTETVTDPSDLGYYIDDQKKRLRLLTDLSLLENQIPFVLLTTLSYQLFPPPQQQGLALSPQKLAESLFGCNVASDDFSKGVYHFLHLIHLCSPDPYRKEKHNKHPLPLQRCARKLQAFGISIKASQTQDSKGNMLLK